MSTDAGALAPTTITGDIVTPSNVIDPLVMPTHAFLNAVRDLIHRSAGYHNEADQHNALDAVDRFEQVFLRGNAKYAVTENDRAGREDVTKRMPPQVGYTPPVNVPAIDYGQLAKAILAAQAEAERDNTA